MITIDFPQIITAFDYHSLGTIEDFLNEYSQSECRSVQFFEVFDPDNNTVYTAIFYQGTKRDAERWLKSSYPDLWQAYKKD